MSLNSRVHRILYSVTEIKGHTLSFDRYFLRVPQDLNRLTLHFRKRKEITDEEEEEGEGGGAGQLKGSSAQDYGIGKTKYWGINLKEERAYSQEPDKAFKFYLATLLILFVIVYIVQAIMVPK